MNFPQVTIGTRSVLEVQQLGAWCYPPNPI